MDEDKRIKAISRENQMIFKVYKDGADTGFW